MLERKPVSFAWMALIPLFISVCLLCGIFGLLGALTGSLSDPYTAIRTSLAENDQLTSFTTGPTTTPGSTSSHSPSTPAGIFSTAGKLPSQTAPLTLTVNGPSNQIETSTTTATFDGGPSLTATPVRASTTTPKATQTPTPDLSASATYKTLGTCDCEEYSEDDPRNLDCTTTSFDTVADAQACFDFCIEKTGVDVYGLDKDQNGQVCEDGLNTPTP